MASTSSPILEPPFISFEETEPQLPMIFPSAQATPIKDLDAIFATSSDPPLFSSDDFPTSSAEHYTQPRRKRQHRRTWFEDEEQNSKRTCFSRAVKVKRGKFSRNFDSGIWLGSDESIESEVSGKGDTDDIERVWPLLEDTADVPENEDTKVVVISVKKGPEWERHLRAKALRTVDDPEDFNGPIWPYWQNQPKDLRQANRVQQSVAQKIGNLIFKGQDIIDLNGHHLTKLRTATLRPLHSIMNTHNLRPNSYVSFAPRLKLYLSSNDFTSIPDEIYHLQFLHVLSLRSNSISEILPSISGLTNLEELNVGCNNLRYLPFELLTLVKSARDQGRFNFFPNPFMRPHPPVPKKPCRFISPILREDGRRLQLAAIGLGRRSRVFIPHPVATTPIAFLDISGASLPHHIPAPSECESYTLSNTTPPLNPSPNDRTNPASLLEICLRTAMQSPNLAQSPFLLPDGPNSHLARLLQRTWHLKQAGSGISNWGGVHPNAQGSKANAGGQNCAICGKGFVIPRTEWVEWWRIIAAAGDSTISQHSQRSASVSEDEDGEGDDETPVDFEDDGMVPLIRRGCSWACVPEMGGKEIRGWVAPTTTTMTSVVEKTEEWED